ncbi:M4 family metallopeptidase [Aquirhabdus sp.]|uniref:M4 family metallopeptidase n=1 Tax=Aquirhabdus sp. TaxID=2824160 RepID=UPI00396C756B
MKSRIKALSAAVMILAAHHATAGDTKNQAAIDRALGLIQQNSGAFKLAAGSASVSTAARASGVTVPSSAATGDQFQAKDVIVDRDGTEHVRFNRTYNGLPVIGGDTVVHSYHGQLKQASLSQNSAINLSQSAAGTTIGGVPKANITAASAASIASSNFGGTVKETVAPKLVVFARNTKPILAYEVLVTGQVEGLTKNLTPSVRKQLKSSLFYISADTGAVLDREEKIQPVAATGTGKTLYLGTVTLTTDLTSGKYSLKDPSRGNGEVRDANNAPEPYYTSDFATIASGSTAFTNTTNVFGDGTATNRTTAAADIAYGLAKTWDFYKNTQGRNGIFNDGKGVVSYAHLDQGYDNAFWSDYSKSMYYGDGSGGTTGFKPVVALDVAGHEMTHGVTSATSALAYNHKDSGGLNEGASDIMGTSVEFYGATSSHPGNYLIGEDVEVDPKNGTNALRWMFKPSLDKETTVRTFTDGTKGSFGSFDCLPAGGFATGEKFWRASSGTLYGNYDPHYTSGVANHFFYLLSEGAVVPAGFTSTLTPSSLVCNGNTTLTAIGHDKAAKIWYKALTQYFTSGTTYAQARTATLTAATDLYGAASTEYKAVAAAWSAVSVN